MKLVFKFFLMLLFVTTFNYSQNGKLKKVKKNLNQHPHSSKNRLITDVQSNLSNPQNPFKSLIATIFWNITYGIVVESIFEKESKMHDASLAKYPFAERKVGNYTYKRENSVLTNFCIENTYLRESKSLFGDNLQAKFRFAKRMDISLDYVVLLEKNTSFTDVFSFYTLTANYHRIRMQQLDVWYGVGLMHVESNVKKSGINFQIGGEWFVKKPFALQATIQSAIINQESITKSEFLLKFYQKRLHFFSGFEKIQFPSVPFHFFAFGLGFNF